MAIQLWCIRVSQARPGDTRGGEDVSRGGEDVSRDELSHLCAAGTGDHKDHHNPRKAGQGVRTVGRVEPEETRTTEGKPGLLSLSPTGKVSRGNVKTAKSCHNGNDLGGRWNPHEMSLSDVIVTELSGLATGSYRA